MDNVVTLNVQQVSPRPPVMDNYDQPLARLQRLGATALRNDELLALALCGARGDALRLAEHVLADSQGLGGLSRLTYSQLANLHGITENKAAVLQAALELGRRMASSIPDERTIVNSPAAAADLLRDMGTEEQETMRALLLDTKNRVMGIPVIYRGSVHTTVIRVSELFREATRRNAVAIIVAHSHPSGDPTPSSVDVTTTREIVQAGKILDIQVLDHLVIGSGQRFVSLKERGLGFN